MRVFTNLSIVAVAFAALVVAAPIPNSVPRSFWSKLGDIAVRLSVSDSL